MREARYARLIYCGITISLLYFRDFTLSAPPGSIMNL